MSAGVRILGLALLVLTAACGSLLGIRLHVHNAGDQMLTTVVIHVTGNRYEVGDLAAGATRSLWIEATGESHVEIEHGRDGNRSRLRVDTYFEAGYAGRLSVEVDADRILHVDDRIRIGPF